MEQVVADVSSAESKATRHLYECVLYYLVVFNLNALSFIHFVVLLSRTFCVDRKYQRALHSGKIFTNALCSGHKM